MKEKERNKWRLLTLRRSLIVSLTFTEVRIIDTYSRRRYFTNVVGIQRPFTHESKLSCRVENPVTKTSTLRINRGDPYNHFTSETKTSRSHSTPDATIVQGSTTTTTTRYPVRYLLFQYQKDPSIVLTEVLTPN